MNTTLTGLGILILVALAAALVGPFFVDWNAFRGEFERQASASLGMPVAIRGDIEARILPTPYLRAKDVLAGDAASTNLQVGDLQLQLGLTPLMSGRLEVQELVLEAPRLDLKIDERGRPVWSPGAGPAALGTDTVALRRVSAVDGAIDVTDLSSGLRQHVDHVRAVGEAVSLEGPFKVDGTFDLAGAPYTLQLNTGRLDANGSLRAKVEVEAADRPLVVRADGTLQTGGERTRYVGALVVQRPAAQRKEGEVGEPLDAPEPWRLEGRLAADTQSIAMELFDLQYGPDERALKLTGSATVALGSAPRFKTSVAARQIDFDRALRRGDEGALTLAQAIERLRAALPHGVGFPIPGQIEMDVAGAVLGGDLIQGIHAAVDVGEAGWTISAARARLPGATVVAASGRLDVTPDLGFAGRLGVNVGELSALLHWLGGNEGTRPRTAVRSIALQGELTASAKAVGIEKLLVDADRIGAEGRVRWTAADGPLRARLETVLSARELQLDDAALAALLHLFGDDSGSIRTLLQSTDLGLKLSAGTVQLGDFQALHLAADLDATASAVDIRSLQLDGAGDSRLSAQGRLSLDPGVTDGRLQARASAQRLAEVLHSLQPILGPHPLMEALAKRADILSPADVDVTLSRDASALNASISGIVGGTGVDISARTGIGADNAVEGRGTFANDNSGHLLKQVGLPVVADNTGARGQLTIEVQGANTDTLKVTLNGSALGFDLSGRGNVGLPRQEANLGFILSGKDLGDGLIAFGKAPPGLLPTVPFRLAGEILLGDGQLAFANLDGKLGGDTVRGRVALRGEQWNAIAGELQFDALPAAIFPALAFGPGALLDLQQAAGVAAAWPTGAFLAPALAGATGLLHVEVDRLGLPGGLEARNSKFRLGLLRNGIAITDFSALLARGRLTGTASLLNNEGDGSLTAMARLSGAALGEAMPLRAGRPVLTGKLDVSADLQTSGRTLSAMAAALGGGGSFAVQGANAQGLDPAVFASALAAVESGADLGKEAVAARTEADLFRGGLPLRSLSGTFNIASGNLRVAGISADTPQAALSGDLSIDIANAQLQASLSLAPLSAPNGEGEVPPGIVVRLEGPLASPRRTLDLTNFTNFLAMRALDIETRRIEAMEADLQERQRFNRLLRMRAAERRWRDEEERAEQARKAEEARRAAEQLRQAEEARRAAEQARQAEEALRLRERQAAPIAPATRSPVLPPSTVVPLPAPIIVDPPPGPASVPRIMAPESGERRSSMDVPARPAMAARPVLQPRNLMEYLDQLDRSGGN